ncbi:methyltransferase domain-containing protein [Halobacillus shinanisalinarum]|uniref:Methyltransferase domain-containing protein n=1 Tax=Halobacillus shinanisalinarum TaxID=2932258 RepID=A0ABY4GYM7_9BACI|nr:class I SAM-dependent methyltransferase [Halobacillus shinanisalinarum]UOQ93121.1 methyltransferase domain-containing protein [Halobacillus shinanisalinarum]
MKQNKYDEPKFFSAYKQMPRSLKGLEAAGEWHILRPLLPELRNKSVLDLGCGFGWHCRFAREQKASSVVGVDISEKMLQKARNETDDPAISYVQMPIEDIEFSKSQFDIVISSLVFHYIESFEVICKKVHRFLRPGGSFIFSVEHPIFTSRNEQNWYVDDQGNRLHWPVDHYQSEGLRETAFLGEEVIKYHRTISTYINDLIEAGFALKAVKEPVPSDEMLKQDSMMKDENRRPMFVIISAEKERDSS